MPTNLLHRESLQLPPDHRRPSRVGEVPRCPRADLAEQRLADLRGALPRMVQAKVAYADAERMASGITVGGGGVGLGRLLSLTPT